MRTKILTAIFRRAKFLPQWSPGPPSGVGPGNYNVSLRRLNPRVDIFASGAGRRRCHCAALRTAAGPVGRNRSSTWPGPLSSRAVILAVEHLDAVDEDAVHADRVAHRARAAAGQVVDPARRRDADRGGIEQQQIGEGAGRDPAAIGDAVEPGLMAGQPAHAFRQIEGAALAHPMAEQVEPEPGIAQIDQMRAGIGQRDDPGLVLDAAARRPRRRH